MSGLIFWAGGGVFGGGIATVVCACLWHPGRPQSWRDRRQPTIPKEPRA